MAINLGARLGREEAPIQPKIIGPIRLSIRAFAVRPAGERKDVVMKQYLLGIYQPDGDPPPPEALEPIMRKLGALNEEMRAAGAWVFGGGLHAPDTATVLQAKDGEVLITDGPYTEGKEHLGGFTVVRAEDLDEALTWGRRMAEIVGLPIEVRPFR
jgi:hypothetical protein